MKIGDLVEPSKESGYILRDSLSQYNEAVVISVNPFMLVSVDSGMLWEATVKIEDFNITGKVDKKILNGCLRRLND